jgi:hypothetical protein
VETVFEQIITRTLAQGKKVIILTSHFDSTLPQHENYANLEIFRVGNSRLSFMLHAFFKGIKILKTHPIDLIHTSTY